MPIQVELIKGNRVVLQTYSEPLDNGQMNALRNKMEQMILPAAEDKLHIIADFRAVKNLPGTILSSGTSMLRRSHSNTGTIVCITPNAFVNQMARVLATLAPKQQFKVVQTLEEAFKEIDGLLAKGT